LGHRLLSLIAEGAVFARAAKREKGGKRKKGEIFISLRCGRRIRRASSRVAPEKEGRERKKKKKDRPLSDRFSNSQRYDPSQERGSEEKKEKKREDVSFQRVLSRQILGRS